MDEKTQSPLTQHLKELRTRLIYCLVFLVLATFAALYVTDKYIFKWLMEPIESLPEVNIQVLGPVDKFGAYFKTSFITGLLFAIPFILYQVWLFLKPGLTKKEQAFLLMMVPSSAALFLIGSAFIYFIMLPASLKFLLGFDIGIEVELGITLERYTSFVLLLLFAGGAIFQIPLIAFFLAKIGIVSARMLMGYRKIALLISTILAALLTPTGDPINLMLLAVPIYVLYEVSILVASVAYPRKAVDDEG
ncbi:twin-arginine translocase subunit TatC [bacterium]|nr:twin-arginine translocase subunit TatC [bacterium]